MIARMLKAYVVARRADRDRLLGALRDLGVVHLAPVDPSKAVPDAETAGAIERFQRAIQILSNVEARGEPLPLGPAEAVDEALRIQREGAERTGRLTSLYHQSMLLEPWGDVRLEDFAALREAGASLRFYAVPAKSRGQVRGEFVHAIRPWPGRRVLVGVADRGQVEVPEGSEAVPLPQRDRPSIRAEAAEIDAALKRDAEKLARLAHAAPSIVAELAHQKEKAAWTVATKSALAEEHLYGLQGWVPETKAAALASGLAAAGLNAAVETSAPVPGDEPPTLIHYTRWTWWAKPMEGLFKILGTVPGYGEFDVSAIFMIFLPVFSAILISDAGYGLMYLVLPIIFYRKMAAAGSAALAQLVIVIGACSLIWGAATCSFFGFDFSWMFGRTEAFIPVTMKKESMDSLMLISITIGAVQLSLAHLWKARAAFPSLIVLAEIGWAAVLWGMYGLVKFFLLNDPESFDLFWNATVYSWLLVGGSALAILFAAPHRNPLIMIGLGLANYPLSFIGTFGDSVSYVRLMAIGLAGSALAGAFNDMGSQVPIFATIPILMVGHALNVSLSIISLFAHGVRLNMLEFSNNLGMQWSGYAYEPFSGKRNQEN
jgi:V/A-type H+-transporting ATPase subunit I